MAKIVSEADGAEACGSARGGAGEDKTERGTQRATQRVTQRVFGPMIAAGAASYARARDLPKLLNVPPEEFEDATIEGTERIVAKLTRAARAQGALGRRRHWSYDMNRHLAVLIALKAERATLAHLRNAEGLARLVAAASLQAASPRAA